MDESNGPHRSRQEQLFQDSVFPLCVLANQCWDDDDYVTVDDFAGGRMAGEHLIQLGHRKIG